MESLLDAVGISGFAFALIFAAAFLGALVQGSIGFGLNLIVVPAIALFRPEALPGAAVVLALPMTFGSAAREWAHVDQSALLWATLGRLPGIGIGIWIVTTLDAEALALAIGAMVIFAVVMSLASPTIQITRSSQAAAGFMGGVMGTSSSIGGPPLALLYQHSAGPIIRSTLGAAFLIGTALSLIALLAAGEIGRLHWQLGFALVPGVLLGLWASRYLHGWLDRGWIRPCVLILCGVAGLAVVVGGLNKL